MWQINPCKVQWGERRRRQWAAAAAARDAGTCGIRAGLITGAVCSQTRIIGLGSGAGVPGVQGQDPLLLGAAAPHLCNPRLVPYPRSITGARSWLPGPRFVQGDGLSGNCERSAVARNFCSPQQPALAVGTAIGTARPCILARHATHGFCWGPLRAPLLLPTGQAAGSSPTDPRALQRCRRAAPLPGWSLGSRAAAWLPPSCFARPHCTTTSSGGYGRLFGSRWCGRPTVPSKFRVSAATVGCLIDWGAAGELGSSAACPSSFWRRRPLTHSPPAPPALGLPSRGSPLLLALAARFADNSDPSMPPLRARFHFLNITNLEAVRQGAKPELVSRCLHPIVVCASPCCRMLAAPCHSTGVCAPTAIN